MYMYIIIALVIYVYYSTQLEYFLFHIDGLEDFQKKCIVAWITLHEVQGEALNRSPQCSCLMLGKSELKSLTASRGSS